MAFDLKNDGSKETVEAKSQNSNATSGSSTPPETKSPKQIHREKKVTPIPRQVSKLLSFHFQALEIITYESFHESFYVFLSEFNFFIFQFNIDKKCGYFLLAVAEKIAKNENESCSK